MNKRKGLEKDILNRVVLKYGCGSNLFLCRDGNSIEKRTIENA
jgi:hypothetical protein